MRPGAEITDIPPDNELIIVKKILSGLDQRHLFLLISIYGKIEKPFLIKFLIAHTICIEE